MAVRGKALVRLCIGIRVRHHIFVWSRHAPALFPAVFVARHYLGARDTALGSDRLDVAITP